MNSFGSVKNPSVEETISQRAGVGPNALVQGWQAMLSRLLDQLKPFLKPAHTVTFSQLTAKEKQVFESVLNHIRVPAEACGVYIPPGVRNQMLYTNRGLAIPDEARHAADDGVLLFSRIDTTDIIINVLLAHPPYAAAADVYQKGSLLAGYVYESIDECLCALDHVVRTHLRVPR